ncbi:hypothetical protein PHYSODRAFT_303232 [Phytophthora sojae]|uniref:Secreted protein n=1 Tax=Phytophthora sojae (strain P6497) TaxID=1094619 RepID=G4ZRN1_PHYSP|nr:hypothetical protein PHYSODRAFT_303232 [Phytophthora sojae]EGZ13840.1 hypothetical protein PHYSODRAFT_303232 [Phytophthora sojae]|eukprot:XP_009531269.1 hypothetical protein PHYSODRAFT_303232 [Phytophthora sojae]
MKPLRDRHFFTALLIALQPALHSSIIEPLDNLEMSVLRCQIQRLTRAMTTLLGVTSPKGASLPKNVLQGVLRRARPASSGESFMTQTPQSHATQYMRKPHLKVVKWLHQVHVVSTQVLRKVVNSGGLELVEWV